MLRRPIGSSNPEPCDNSAEIWTLALFRRLSRASNMHKTGNTLIRGKSEKVEHAPVVGVPFRDPARGVAHGMRRKNQTHGRGSGGELLLPLRNLYMRSGPADDGDHQRCAREPFTFEVYFVRCGVGTISAEYRSDCLARCGAC